MAESIQLQRSRDNLQLALQDKFSIIWQKELELEQFQCDHRKITKELEEVQQALEDLALHGSCNSPGMLMNQVEEN